MTDDKKKKFGMLKIIGIVVILLLAALAAIPFIVDANQFRPKLEAELTSALDREVKVGNLRLSLFSGSVAADEIAIADDPAFSRSPFVRAKSLRVGVELRPLIFSKVVRVTGIVLDQPEISLIRSASGEWNFSSIGAGPKGNPDARPAANPPDPGGMDVSVGLLKVSGGRVTVTRGGGSKPRVYDRVEVEARDLSFASVFPFTLTAGLPGGGSLKLDGKAGPMNRGDASLTPLAANLAVTGLDIVASGFVEPGSGLAGLLDFNGNLTSDGKTAQSRGSAKVEKLRIVKGGSSAGLPVSCSYVLDHNLKDMSGTLSDTKVEFGKAVARLNGTYNTRGESTVLNMKLRGDNMPAQDLEAMLPSIGISLPKGASLQGGTLGIDMTAEGPVDKLVSSGSVGLVNTRLVGFDLGSKLATVASLTGIKPNQATEIEKLASDLRMTPDGIQVNNLLLIVKDLGQLTGNGTVASNQSLDFKMLASLSASSGIASTITRVAGGNLNVPFFVRGTTSNPAFVPDVKGAAGSLLESVVSGKDKKGEAGALGNALRGLFGKKK